MHGFLNFANPSNRFNYENLLIAFVDNALQEDIGAGDMTTEAIVPIAEAGSANFLVKEDCVIAGLELVRIIFHRVDPSICFVPHHKDGDFIKAGTIAGRVSGNIQSLLKTERLVLNAMQRMSAIATKAQKLVQKAEPFGVTILDTRKTTPNFRICEKWAVAIGGGMNHRFALYDQILIKDNHIKVAGGIRQALENLAKYLESQKIKVPVVVEVKDESEFEIAIQCSLVNRILMDNFAPNDINTLIRKYSFSQKLEASGGIDDHNIDDYLQSGVHFLSIGDLTHHIQSIDISLKVQ